MIAGHLALIAAIRSAVIRERVRRNFNSFDFLAAKGLDMADRLKELGFTVDRNIRTNVYVESGRPRICGDIFFHGGVEFGGQRRVCDWYVVNRFDGTRKRYRYELEGNYASTLAYQHRDRLRDDFRMKFEGEDFDEIINALETLQAP